MAPLDSLFRIVFSLFAVRLVVGCGVPWVAVG